MNRNALLVLNPSGSDLILTSYFSLLTYFGYMVIAIPVHLSVYNYVCVCVCVWMYLFYILDVFEFECNPFLAVNFFTAL